MTSHTINLSDDEQRVITWLTDRFNSENGARITPTEFLQAQIPGILKPYLRDFNAARESRVLSAFRGAAEQTKADIETSLNITSKA